MCLHPQDFSTVPEETARIARAAFPKGNPLLTLRDKLGVIYQDDVFTPLFASPRGRPAESPACLALVTVLQFAENLSDRQAADAVRGRIDWKYLLGLDLTDPGFHYSVLCDFRRRVLENEMEQRLLDQLLQLLKRHQLIKERGKQRTDSTHVLAAIRDLNRLECVGETLRAALNSLAVVVPEWLRGHVPPEWFERYAKRIEQSRLPDTLEEQRQMAKKGAFIEHCFNVCIPLFERLDPKKIAEAIKVVGAEHCILSTDLGQAGNPTPVEGARMMIAAMLECGLGKQEVEFLVKTNPSRLLNLD